ncbi:glycerate kinase [Gilliamella sp. wkB178]|uniref:glycerate kinase n=1 Tax=Gilliamella sp. wkB178 TaxID=3120259 RepID=UPI00080E5087|nr:glycerate kinase [Gilliamella apicola]OCG06547.1 glycerate kinase [Gilliamella apicola]
MKIVIAPDSFKESLSAKEVASIIKAGFSQIYTCAEFALIPVADGGEGTVDAMVDALKGCKITVPITDPLGENGTAFYGISGDGHTAIIEMASASGLERVPINKRNAKITTSYGTGELIKDALDHGCNKFIIGIGGSATNDGGAGMLQALGVKLLDKFGNQIGYGGASLALLEKIDITQIDSRLKDCEFEVACDVTNPLTGENGASAIFGPQKGASLEDVKLLDSNLKHFAHMIKQFLNVDIEQIPGTGAAGGMGAALLAFFNAKLRPGIEIITNLLKLDCLIKQADLVITGEGRLDYQSVNGKVPIGVAQIAKKHNKPVIAIVGSLGDRAETVYPYGITAMFSILSKVSTLSEALDSETAKVNLYNSAINIALTLKLGSSLKNNI